MFSGKLTTVSWFSLSCSATGDVRCMAFNPARRASATVWCLIHRVFIPSSMTSASASRSPYIMLTGLV